MLLALGILFFGNIFLLIQYSFGCGKLKILLEHVILADLDVSFCVKNNAVSSSGI